ncbi:capsid protein [Rahnella rivi]|uniref:capsid protein n=1 Tax=Rahnella TaxID=34037 RepID=UPI0039B0A7AF
MKPDSTKTVEAVIQDVLQVKAGHNEKPSSGNAEGAIQRFEQAKAAFAEKKRALDEIESSIARCAQEKETANSEIKENEESWRSRFRKSRGVMTDELKNAHSQRAVQQGLVKEFDDLIEELNVEKQSAMLHCANAGGALISAHRSALNAYADTQWRMAINNLSPALVRAVKLKLLALSTVSYQETQSGHYVEPAKIVSADIGKALVGAASIGQFNMDAEPMLEKIGMHSPALPGVDMALLQSPIKRQLLAQKLSKRVDSNKE